MDNGAILSESFTYTKEFCKDISKWIVVFVFFLVNIFSLGLIPLYSGYLIRVMEKKDGEAPTNKIGNLFVNGWKYNLATIVWFLPVILIAGVSLAMFFMVASVEVLALDTSGVAQPNYEIIDSILPGLVSMMVIGLLILVIGVILSLFYSMGLVHMARENSFAKAFSVKEIYAVIKRMGGWIEYIIALLIPIVIVFGVTLILELVGYLFAIPVVFNPVLGLVLLTIWMIIWIFITIPLMVFLYRYLSLIYDVNDLEETESMPE